MRQAVWASWVAFSALAGLVHAQSGDLGASLQALRAVGPQAAGHREAAQAWRELARADATQLPAVLAGMDGAGPLAINWIAAAVDAIAERQLRRGGRLPETELEKFLLDRRHAPRARRLAYEWLVRGDPKAPERLLPGMLDDPSPELRREAVASRIEQAEAFLKAGQQPQALAVYQEALVAARDLDQVRLVAERLRKLGQAVDLPRRLGYVVRWRLIGPFDNTGGKGFSAVYPPEREIRFDAVYPGKSGPVRWIEFVATDDLGTVDFNKALGEQKGVVGYATTEFLAQKRQSVQLRATSVNALKLWVNGKLLAEHEVYHSGSQPDQYVATTLLEPGRNVILVKVCQNELAADWARQWDFQLRVCDADGAPILSANRP